ncbi:MAG: aspartate kinase [Micavibrio sp.]|nr:MAG: aspartate kinase [Micavibrio sp.]
MRTRTHTVEKIGGTSMADTQAVMDNVLIGERTGDALYNRIFVVSAYAGITDMLLEHKKTRKPGVFALFSGTDSEWAWSDAVSKVCTEMRRINAEIFADKTDRAEADRFVRERIEGVRSCLIDLNRLCSYGHFKLQTHLKTVREMLSAVGEAHSTFNTTLLLQKCGVNAQFIDLTGWRDMEHLDLDAHIRKAFDGIDLSQTLPIVTGYTQCNEGIVNIYNRGYTEITFSRIAVLTGAREAIIHKEYHLSSADPAVISEDRIYPIGKTNYDVADQLSNLGMEAVHPRAAKGLRQAKIPLRIRNTFERDHEGTLIENGYRSKEPCVEIIAGRRGVYAVEFFDQDMVGATGYDEEILKGVRKNGLKSIVKDYNANTITYYLSGPLQQVKRLTAGLQKQFPNAKINIHKVAIVAAIGSDMNKSGLLAEALDALETARIAFRAAHQTMRLADIQFVIYEDDYEKAVNALHRALIEPNVKGDRIAPAA